MTWNPARKEVIAASESHRRAPNLVSGRISAVGAGRFSYAIRLIYTIRFLLHFPARIPAIGVICADLIFIGLLSFSMIRAYWTLSTIP